MTFSYVVFICPIFGKNLCTQLYNFQLMFVCFCICMSVCECTCIWVYVCTQGSVVVEGIIFHFLETITDILDCEFKGALERITTNKASGGDGIPVELFQILKNDAVKVLHSICQKIWKTQQWPWDWKRSVSIPIPKKGNAKECSNYHTIALISHTSKVMLKFSKPVFSNM